jgi:acid phosphatase family membrane protein YuiD
MIVDISYAVTPFVAWLVAGGLKFVINSVRARRLAFGLVGYGGLPSNHSAIVSSIAAVIAVREGIGTPAFGVAVALAFIVVLDAKSLRGQIGKHAVVINKLNDNSDERVVLRERIGHTLIEIVSGLVVGSAVGVSIGLLTTA